MTAKTKAPNQPLRDIIINLVKLAILLIIAIFLYRACKSVLGNGGGSGGSSQNDDLAEARNCIKLNLYHCENFTPQAEATNKCSKKIYSSQVRVSVYDKSGSKVESDIEFIENLTVGDTTDLEFVLSGKEAVASCSINIENVVFLP
jgi:hypothetical protein